MATPPFDPASEPLGSSHPLVRDINTKNLDIAVNTKEQALWVNRFGEESPTLWLLTQLQEAANAIVGGGDDITQAWRSAIHSGARYRIADNALAYTSSLADGNATQRPPLPASGDSTFLLSTGLSGAAFSVAAPANVAFRELILLPLNQKLEVRILTGISVDALNDDFVIGMAWYGPDKTRLASVPTTERYRDALTAGRYEDTFTVGLEGSEADIEAPEGAVYMTVFYGSESTTGRFWAAELFVTYYIERAEDVIYPQVGFGGFVGQSLVDYSHETATANVPPVPKANVIFGSAGARIAIVADSDRSVLAGRGLLPVNADGTLHYDVYYGIASLQTGGGSVEVGAAWFDENRNFISDSVARAYLITDVPSLPVIQNVVRGRLFDTPANARYARPFVRITGSDGQVAVLNLYSRSAASSEYYGEALAGHPSRIFPVTATSHSYDPSSPRARSLLSGGVQSVIDDISGATFEYLGGALVRPEFDVIDGYPALSTPASSAVKARLTARSGVIYSPPSTLVFTARADSSVSTLRPLIHKNEGAGSKLRINANAIRNFQSLWLSTPGRIGIAIDGATGGRSSDGNPLAALLPQDEWGVLSLILKKAPARSEIWCNGALVDTFLCPDNIADGRADLFSAINSSWDTNGVALGRICSADVAVSDAQRKALERWASQPIGLPLAVERQDSQPVLIGTSFAAMRVSDGATLFDQSAHKKQNMASVVKLIVALIVDRWVIDWDETTVIVDGSQHGLETGDVISVRDAVCAMLMPSNNLTPTSLGLKVGEIIQAYEGIQGAETARDRAYREMRNISQSLGIVFPDYDGFFGGTLNGNQLSALDVCRAVRFAYSSPRLMDCMSRATHDITVVDGPDPRIVTVETSVQFLVDGSLANADIIAGKTGTTEATGQSLTVLAKMPGGDIVAAALSGSPADPGRYAQMRTLLDYVRRQHYS